MKNRYLLLASILGMIFLSSGSIWADDWPGWLGPKGDSNWEETGIIESFPPKGPPVRWRAEVGLGYSGPAVAAGKVYVSDFITRDTFTNNPVKRDVLKGEERLLCLDAATGKLLWKYSHNCTYELSFPGGPRATPAVSNGKVYSFGAEGNLVCLEADSGKVVWQLDVKKQYGVKSPLWGFSSSPLLDGERLFLIIGGKGSTAICLDRNNGKEIWKSLSASEPGYSTPALISAGGQKQLVIWHPESVNGLNPDDGSLYWTHPIKPNYAMSIMTPRKAGDYLYVGGIVTVGLGLKLKSKSPEAEIAYQGEKDKGIFPVNSTPIVVDDLLYGVSQDGELMAVRPATGEQLWQTLKATVPGDRKTKNATAFLVQNGKQTLIFNELGELILANLSPKGYEEKGRAKLIEPTNSSFDRPVVWSHPAFANKCIFVRNDKEIICVSLAKEEK